VDLADDLVHLVELKTTIHDRIVELKELIGRLE
jgi:hypothetical protein